MSTHHRIVTTQSLELRAVLLCCDDEEGRSGAQGAPQGLSVARVEGRERPRLFTATKYE